jgi:hypothetical protein
MEVGYRVFPRGKRYAYVMMDGAPVFLRNIVFIHNAENPSQIVIVHEWGMSDHRWEPPKGQFEWDELGAPRKGVKMTYKQILLAMRRGILRETKEEAKIMPSELINLIPLENAYIQDWTDSGVPNAKFMYQYWHATITPATMLEAQTRTKELVDNKDWRHLLPPDVLEKDAIRWWSPKMPNAYKHIRGGFSQKMTSLYFETLNKARK